MEPPPKWSQRWENPWSGKKELLVVFLHPVNQHGYIRVTLGPGPIDMNMKKERFHVQNSLT